MNLRTQNHYLDQVERALPGAYGGRRQSETSFLQRLLRELPGNFSAGELSPAGLLRAVLHNLPLMHNARDVLEVLATPSRRPEDALRAGDWLLRAVPGTGDVGHLSILVSGDLRTPSALASEGIAAEGRQPGYYGLIIEAGAFPHSRSRLFARRLLDSLGRVPPQTVILRPKYSDPGTMTNFPPDEPEPNGVAVATDVEELEEFSGCPPAEDFEVGEQARPQPGPGLPAPAAGPDSTVANRFVAAHPTRYCTPGQARSATCQTLVAPRPIRRVVIHVLAVPSTARRSGVEAVVAGWQNAGRQASAHYLVDRDGTITQMVREANVAFHTPGNNRDSIGIEHADVCNDPAPLTTQLYERSAALVNDLATRHRFAINNNTVAGHSQVNPNHADPGPYWDWEYFFLLLAWAGRGAASRPIRLVASAAGRPAPAGWQLQRRRAIPNDRCANRRDPWGASYWRAQPSANAAAAELSLVVDEACTYKVSLWWPDVAGANPAVPVDIEVASLTSPSAGTSTQSVVVNQRPNAGRWNDVAVVNVTQTPAEVKVRWRRNSAQGGWILVDAVRLLKIASCPTSPSSGGAEDAETATDGVPAAEEDLEYDAILQRIRHELTLRFKDPNDPGLFERRLRLRELFASVPGGHARQLHARLGERPTGDELSALFHGQLATATRRELLIILHDRFPAESALPIKQTPPTTGSPCRREMGSMTALLPWERSLLALVHDKSQADFNGVVLLIGPIFLPGLMPSILRPIVETALKKNYAITIGNNIWFPRAIDTSTVNDLALLVHESVHVMDYAVAGIEAFLKTYVEQALVHAFKHDDIPHEQRANRIEEAAKQLFTRFPDLVNTIRSCDGSAIMALLAQQRSAYRAAF